MQAVRPGPSPHISPSPQHTPYTCLLLFLSLTWPPGPSTCPFFNHVT